MKPDGYTSGNWTAKRQPTLSNCSSEVILGAILDRLSPKEYRQ